MVEAADQLGDVAQNTAMGPVFRITPISTDSGQLKSPKNTSPRSKANGNGGCGPSLLSTTTNLKRLILVNQAGDYSST